VSPRWTLGRASMSLTFRERVLYHQIHPLKLAVDWSTGLVSAILLWRHRLVPGVFWGLLPPVVVSVPFLLGVSDATMTRYRASPLGRYVARFMTRTMEGLRLLGFVAICLGAWQRRPLVIAAGLALVVGAWARGWLWPPQDSTPSGGEGARSG
jgi:hypothetical protein